jgi:hypothetical protein
MVPIVRPSGGGRKVVAHCATGPVVIAVRTDDVVSAASLPVLRHDEDDVRRVFPPPLATALARVRTLPETRAPGIRTTSRFVR